MEYDITKMAAGEMAIPLATGIQKVFRSGEAITYSNIRLQQRDLNRTIRPGLSAKSFGATMKGRI